MLIGDLTPQGYEKKKSKIYEEYSSSSSSVPAASEIASKMSSSESVHNTLKKIFGQKSLRKGGASKSKSLKPTTVILLPNGTKTLPRGKKKDSLRESGYIGSCIISPDDNSASLTKKIVSIFPSLNVAGFNIMTSTKSGDIFEARLPDVNGETVTDFIANGPLLISSRAAVVTPIVKYTHHDGIKQLGNCVFPFTLSTYISDSLFLPFSLYI